MDLFDTSAYFSCKVPILATTRPLLKSAICALAAKHLSRTGSRTHGSSRTSFAGTPRAPDWDYHAVRYYHQAIRRLKTSIAAGGNGDEEDEPGPDRSGTGGRNADTFAAVAILCVYELMTAPGNAWKAHLTALPLYSSADEGLSNCSPVPIPSSPVRGPIFWSLARQDFLCAFISETQTRLNSDHVRIWQNFGLAAAVDQDPPLLLSFSPFSASDARAPADAAEDTKSNELLWLLGKIVNFITSGDAISSQDYSRPAGQRMSLGITQEILLETWHKLEAELDAWFDGLPPTFTPSARTKVPGGDHGDDGVEQIWYDVPMCAATMQSYHMARILLLVNRPQESTAIRSTVSARLRSYRTIQREVLRHGLEICGISLADPTAPVRIHSVQPLFVAGQSFHEPREQKLVLELLSGIEEELGWATGYQIRKLTDEWPVE
ncbi:zn 2cys6 transcription factor [Colletotrichum sojae]|uniref:Zn 2cys6 transcription factor n=1 Tax=Colletotrichum sojae TaxID=2175907 RepID=A0A8H6JBH7_9PEZI|nr:zn 2cys6 transcription factor [Colletotrichum sojae]